MCSGRHKGYFLIAILVTLCLTRCKKKDKPNEEYVNTQLGHECVPQTAEITDSTLLKCKFKSGSWWAFKDSISGVRDTLWVTSHQMLVSLSIPELSECALVNTHAMGLLMGGEAEPALARFNCQVYHNAVLFFNKNLWTGGGPVIYNVSLSNNTILHKYDSLYVYDRYYKHVSESIAFEYVQDADPSRMVSRSEKIYFSPDWGFVQIEQRDRLTAAIIHKFQLVDKKIIR